MGLKSGEGVNGYCGSGVVYGHHLHPSGPGVCIPHGRDGLVQPLRALVGGVRDHMEEDFCVSALESALRRHVLRPALIQEFCHDLFWVRHNAEKLIFG